MRKSGRRSNTYKVMMKNPETAEVVRDAPMIDIIADLKDSRGAAKAKITTNQKLIDNIKNTKITDLTADEKAAPYKALSIGTVAVSTILGFAAGIKFDIDMGPWIGLGTGLGAVTSTSIGDKSKPSYWVNNQQKK